MNDTFYVDKLENHDCFGLSYCCVAFSAAAGKVFLVTFKGEEMSYHKYGRVSAAKKGFAELYKRASVEPLWRDNPTAIEMKNEKKRHN
ncbi:MAG: hypothetical protein KAW12_07500 [Candidatus Aminicenantes bacterium]|nr:hypothetical protein [Candidatus Aminicenantes bacterium]